MSDLSLKVRRLEKVFLSFICLAWRKRAVMMRWSELDRQAAWRWSLSEKQPLHMTQLRLL